VSVRVHVVSFGYGHRDDPPADVTIDLRHRIRDPHTSPAMRQLTGMHPEVRAHIAHHPGVRDLVADAYRMTVSLARLGTAPVVVAFGCVGGRHRSVVLAELLYLRALGAGWAADIHHRHIDMPVLDRTEDYP
jgi:UPF0042 nucleotide-binding protein